MTFHIVPCDLHVNKNRKKEKRKFSLQVHFLNMVYIMQRGGGSSECSLIFYYKTNIHVLNLIKNMPIHTTPCITQTEDKKKRKKVIHFYYIISSVYLCYAN